MKNLMISALMALCATPTFALAQLEGVQGHPEVGQVEQANAKLTTMQCPFVRTTKVAALKESTKSEGTFCFSSPERLSMRYKNGELFVVGDESVSMGQGSRVRTVKTTNRGVGELAATLVACVRGRLKQIAGKLVGVKTVGHTTLFTIKTDLSVGRNKVTKVELAYAKSDMSLVSLNMVEDDGSYTLYELKDKTLGKPIDAKTFEVADKRQNRQGGGNRR